MNLEEALQEHEQQVDALLKSANRYVGALKAWKKACQVGHIGNLQKSAATAEEMIGTLPSATGETRSSWQFDVRAYLEGNAWREELQAALAEKYDVRSLLDESGNLISSPVVVRAQPGRGVLVLGKLNWPTLHPRVTAAELKRLRDRTAAANSQEFLESLHAVWERSEAAGQLFATFREVYDLFSLTPGWKRENPPAAFGQAIYALHRSDVQTTRGGKSFEMVTPSANAKTRDIFTVFAEDGRELRYYGIRFRK